MQKMVSEDVRDYQDCEISVHSIFLMFLIVFWLIVVILLAIQQGDSTGLQVISSNKYIAALLATMIILVLGGTYYFYLKSMEDNYEWDRSTFRLAATSIVIAFFIAMIGYVLGISIHG